MNVFEDSKTILCFPAITDYSARRGVYVMPESASLIKEMTQGSFPLENATESARLRVELACAGLWPHLRDLFVADFFPHMGVAAMELLRAADFCETEEIIVRRLTAELAAALKALEATLVSAAEPGLSRAAEPEER